MDILVYCFCYNDDSERQATLLALRHPGVKVRRLEKNRYFESQFFTEVTEDEMMSWSRYSYVGFISYQFYRKIGLPEASISFAQICMDHHGADVIALHDWDVDMIPQAIHHHGLGFIKAWQAVLQPFFDQPDIVDRSLPSFFCSLWIAKPALLTGYCGFCKEVRTYIDQSPHVQKLLDVDSQYRGGLKPDQLLSITGRPFYTLHPFVFERLPAIYFYNKGAHIARRNRPESRWQKYRPFDKDIVADMVQGHRRVAIFASHSELTYLHKNTVKYISAVAKFFDVVIVVTTQHHVHNRGELPVNCVLQQTKNHCHDFGLYWRVLLSLPSSHTIHELLLFNDSCWCVDADKFADVFGRASALPDCFWGMTESNEIMHHLQTFFVGAKGHEAIAAMIDFARSMKHKLTEKHMSNKSVIVYEFEIGMSVFVRAKGVQIRSIYSIMDVSNVRTTLTHAASRANPSYYHWDRLLALGCPLVKKARQTYHAEYNFIQQYS